MVLLTSTNAPSYLGMDLHRGQSAGMFSYVEKPNFCQKRIPSP